MTQTYQERVTDWMLAEEVANPVDANHAVEVTEEMRQAFYCAVIVEKTGRVRDLDDGYRAMLAAAKHVPITQKMRDVALEKEPNTTVRQYYAAQALSGLIVGYTTAYGSPTSHIDEVCTEAFRYADAMVAAETAK